MVKRKTDTVPVVVKTGGYVYHGHTYVHGETIHMDPHDLAGPIDRKQVAVKAEKKPKAEKKAATEPSKTMATAPTSTRQ